MLHRAGVVAVAAVVTFSLGARGAEAAEARTSSLGWARLAGAETCIGGRELARAVERRLARTVFVSPAEAGVSVEGNIAPRGGGGFRAHLAISDDHGVVLGTRDLEGDKEDCRALDDDIALVVALLIDPEAALGRKPVPFPTPVLLPPARVVVERVYVPVPAPAREEPWRVGVAIGPAFAAGVLPGVAVGVALRGEITPRRFVPLEIGGAVWRDARTTQGDHGVTLSLSYASIGACPLTLQRAGTRLNACAAAALGAVHAEGFGFTRSEGQESAVFDLALEGRVAQRLFGPVEVSAGLSVALALVRARFFFLDAAGAEQEIYRIGAVAGVADLGLGVSFR